MREYAAMREASARSPACCNGGILGSALHGEERRGSDGTAGSHGMPPPRTRAPRLL
ncbi:hypothetical protein [Gemmatimonas sp.]|uniref:hypothetical protein n=1 Tax=Gemmatimonas sp. TaxID=1962908 RepID=UPI00356518C3